MEKYEQAYQRLNAAQREAVDTIDGPVLVIAGPGTGKTQLLTARVAQILKQTDTLPQNILCLTFTENGAENMRERLTRFIDQAAYDVTISTYHAFGGDLIQRFPEYFAETRLQNPVDALGRHQIVARIVDGMAYDNPLKQTRHHLNDLIGTISEVKRALLSSDDLRAIASENNSFIDQANRAINHIFDGFTTMPRGVGKAVPLFTQALEAITHLAPEQPTHPRFGSLASIAAEQLTQAIASAETTNKTTPLTAWKNAWLAKDSSNKFIFDGTLQNERIEALAHVIAQYQAALEARGLYDFDDMIIRSITALEQHSDLRYTLQEKYLYLLLDEFQDTNAAQLRLVELLTDNPVHEGRPNVMAVGDDDQAIYAFQGAQYSNMLDFHSIYKDVKVINLTENYRSHRDVLETAHNVASQIAARLHHQFPNMTKTLKAANSSLPVRASIKRAEFASDLGQNAWIAAEIRRLVNAGVPASEIAVLAPKHKQLTPLIGYLNALDIPVRYEKRENILETTVVRQLLCMSRLVLALHERNEILANSLWPEVLSYEFWQIPTSTIWRVSWQITDNKQEQPSWGRELLATPECRPVALLFLTLANMVSNETCESMIDYLIGTALVSTNEPDLPKVGSSLRDYYTSVELQASHPALMYDTLSHIKVLHSKLCDYQQTFDRALTLQDLVDFVAMYEAAEERMINTSPYNQQTEAVQLMTVFKAKGLEFAYVFMPSCHDDVWGGSSRGNANRLTLPQNLAPIRHAGATDDERLRILFVALTRAKYGLYLTSYKQNYSGKASKYLKYLNEQIQDDGSFRSLALPEAVQAVASIEQDAPTIAQLEIDWRHRHITSASQTDLSALLGDRLKRYRMSPTHLNTFTDLIYGGPQRFFFSTILRFPQAPSVDGQYGSAIHETLEWVQIRVAKSGAVPTSEQVLENFTARMKTKKLTESQTNLEIDRGRRALSAYIVSRHDAFKADDLAEYNFSHENVHIGEVHMSGKIDKLSVNKTNKTIIVTDYKTGKSYDRWKPDAKLHKYKQQLYCYKLLVEGSRAFADYEVTAGVLDFVEPDSDHVLHRLELSFQPEELERVRQLLQAMWRRVVQNDLPDTSHYTPDLKGILAFEDDLIAGNI